MRYQNQCKEERKPDRLMEEGKEIRRKNPSLGE
jgi:hypothetical protein